MKILFDFLKICLVFFDNKIFEFSLFLRKMHRTDLAIIFLFLVFSWNFSCLFSLSLLIDRQQVEQGRYLCLLAFFIEWGTWGTWGTFFPTKFFSTFSNLKSTVITLDSIKTFSFYFWFNYKCLWMFLETSLLSIFFFFVFLVFSVFFSKFVSFCGKTCPFFLNFEIGIAFENLPFAKWIYIFSWDL